MTESQKIIGQIQDKTNELDAAIDRDIEKLEDEKEILEEQLKESIQPKTLDESLSLPILKRFANQLNITQIEMLEQFAVTTFAGFNPHI